MKVYIYGSGEDAKNLSNQVKISLEELGLTDFIELEMTESFDMKDSLGITQSPALIIEEDSINFKDMIFEGIIPANEEIKSMFLSIIGTSSGGSGGCSSGGCGSGCSC